MIPSLLALLVVAQPAGMDGGLDGGSDGGIEVRVVREGIAPAPEPLSPYSWDVVGCQTTPGLVLPAAVALLLLARRRRAWLALLGVGALSASAAPSPRPRLVVVGVVGRELSEALAEQLRALDVWDVSVRGVIECPGAVCSADVLAALGVERVLVAEVDASELRLTLLEGRTGQPIHRASRVAPSSGWVAWLPEALRELRAHEPRVLESGVGTALPPGAPPPVLSFALSARVEGDVWGRMGIAPSVQAALRYGFFGAAFTGIVVPLFGVRFEGRFLPLPRARLNPWIGGGTTLFLKPYFRGPEGLLFYVRAALGLIVAFGKFELSADAAAEYLVAGSRNFSDVALVVSGGAGWHF